MRELACLTVPDKVMQRAVLNVIDPIIDKRFLNCSHGYRQKRSVATAVQQVLNFRNRGFRWMLDADIAHCFDSLDHKVLINLVHQVVVDWFALNLTQLWLEAGRKHRNQPVGVPMGAVLAPLGCNIYLHQLDARLTTNGWQVVRFADDYFVMTTSREAAEQVWKVTENVLESLRLKLALNKTRGVSFEEGFQFLGVHFYRDTFSYLWKKKRIEVQGSNLWWPYRYVPKFYN